MIRRVSSIEIVKKPLEDRQLIKRLIYSGKIKPHYMRGSSNKNGYVDKYGTHFPDSDAVLRYYRE